MQHVRHYSRLRSKLVLSFRLSKKIESCFFNNLRITIHIEIKNKTKEIIDNISKVESSDIKTIKGELSQLKHADNSNNIIIAKNVP